MSDDAPIVDLEEPTEAELAEGRRFLARYPDSPSIESFTCLGCVGRRLRSESNDDELASWSDLARFAGDDVKTLCPLAWDQYNTDGDCLALK